MQEKDRKADVWQAYLNVQRKIEKLKADRYNALEDFGYVSLDQKRDFLRPLCNEEGLILEQEPTIAMMGNSYIVEVETTLTHVESNNRIIFSKTKMPLEAWTLKDAGTGFTKAAKYALDGIFGMTSEKDVEGLQVTAAKTELDIAD